MAISRTVLTFSLLLFAATLTLAAEPAKKPAVGDHVPSYASVKCGGVDDGVAVGKTTCYTCRSGPAPVFFIFAQSPDASLIPLLQELDKLVAAHQEQKVTGVVNFLGSHEDDSARKEVAAFGATHGLKHVALTITDAGDKFGLDAGNVTVILFENGIITMRDATPTTKLDDKAVAAVVETSKKLLE